MFRSPWDHPQGVRQALLKLHYVPLTCTLMQVMWEHALGIKLCQCRPVLSVPDITASNTHLQEDTDIT